MCKKWENVLGSHTSPWKKGIELDCEKKGYAVEERKMRAIFARSKGEIQTWKITLYLPMLDYFEDLYKFIPTSNAQSLHIEFVHDDTISEPSDCDYSEYSDDNDDSDAEDDRHDRIRMDHMSWQRDCDKLVRAIKQCSNLKLLDISAAPDASDFDMSFGSDFKLTPLAKCRLESLSLDGINLNSLCKDGSIFHLVSQARHIDLSSYAIGTELEVVRLIEAAKDTLETCSVALSGKTQHGEKFRSIVLPRLQQLKVLGLQYPDSTYPMQYSLSCPNLRYLDIRGKLPSALCANLLTDSVNVLRLDLSKELCQALQDNLRKCSNLTKIKYENGSGRLFKRTDLAANRNVKR